MKKATTKNKIKIALAIVLALIFFGVCLALTNTSAETNPFNSSSSSSNSSSSNEDKKPSNDTDEVYTFDALYSNVGEGLVGAPFENGVTALVGFFRFRLTAGYEYATFTSENFILSCTGLNTTSPVFVLQLRAFGTLNYVEVDELEYRIGDTWLTVYIPGNTYTAVIGGETVTATPGETQKATLISDIDGSFIYAASIEDILSVG